MCVSIYKSTCRFTNLSTDLLYLLKLEVEGVALLTTEISETQACYQLKDIPRIKAITAFECFFQLDVLVTFLIK